jgi:ADP-heptose:LPS heptosyltransferase
MPERIILRNTQSPGDYVVLSAAIRDIQRAHPGRFELMMDVPQQAVFAGSPYLRGFHKTQPGVKQVVAQYPAIHQSNQRRGIHFMWGFIEDLNQKLRANAVLTEFRPDLHLSEDEKATPPCGLQRPYWVFASGGKKDYTAKWWDPQSWQQVVSMMVLKGHRMVQVGGGSHIHPPVPNTIDLVGKTSFRELMRLIYHADGVMCIVTCLMHIAAAFNRPCVVVAGGREPWWWEGYTAENRITNMLKGQPNWTVPANDNFIPHQYLHTIGQLDCCQTGGCWLSRIEGQGSVCKKPVAQNGRVIPRCLQMITPEMVVDAAESYYRAGMIGDRPRELILPPSPPPPPPPPPTELAQVVRGRTVVELKTALAQTKASWLIWATPECDQLPADKWIESALARLESQNAAMGGLLSWRYVDTAQADLLKSYLVKPLPRSTATPGKMRAWTMGGGLTVLRVSYVSDLNWSDQIPDEWLDLVLAETAIQRGVRVMGLADLLRYL